MKKTRRKEWEEKWEKKCKWGEKGRGIGEWEEEKVVGEEEAF